MLVGAHDEDYRRPSSGSAYAVYGKAGTRSVDLTSIGKHGFRIDGAWRGQGIGASVAAIDDLNGDGLPDFVIGSYGTNVSYAVWKKPSIP